LGPYRPLERAAFGPVSEKNILFPHHIEPVYPRLPLAGRRPTPTKNHPNEKSDAHHPWVFAFAVTTLGLFTVTPSAATVFKQ
jgi:hypothetical protein